METLNETLGKPGQGKGNNHAEPYSSAAQRNTSQPRKKKNTSANMGEVSRMDGRAVGGSAGTEEPKVSGGVNTEREHRYENPDHRPTDARRGNRYFVDEDGFVHRNLRKRNSAVIGKGKNNKLRVTAIIKKKDVFVTRLHEDTTCDEIKDHVIATTGDESPQVIKLQNKHSGYSSFRITCNEQYFNLLLSEDSWEEGILVRPFYVKNQRRQLHSENFQNNQIMAVRPNFPKVNIASFYCSGFKSSKEYICNFILNNVHIVALQETWLMPHEISLPGSISRDFSAFSLSSVDVGSGLLRGRPYGGLSFMWHESLSQCVRIVTYDDDRLLGLFCNFNNTSCLFLNVYLPTECPENYDDFMLYLGKIVAIANDCEADAVCVLGDFNASPSSVHFNELRNMCLEYDLEIADVNYLPASSYTHVNNNSYRSCSWLDHIVVSKNILRSFGDCNIDYGGATSDHFPIGFSLCFDGYVLREVQNSLEDKIDWDFDNLEKRAMFANLLERYLTDFEIGFSVCDGLNCNYELHCREMDICYDRLRNVILSVAVTVFGYRKNKNYVVPGWNIYVSESHEKARRDFLYWRSMGSPREGIIAYNMRTSRSRFKLALRNVGGRRPD